jgi:pilus assembly protein Flp/PilA
MRRLTSMTTIRRFLAAQEGATAIEYAIIASGLSIAIAAAVTALGAQVRTNLYEKLANLL